MLALMSPAAMSLLVPVILLVLISSGARAIHFELFERYFKLTFANAPVWSLFYFSAWSALIIVLFPAQVGTLFASVSFVGYMTVTFLLLAVFPALYHGVRTQEGEPVWLAHLFPTQGMLTLGERYILAKIADVVFQQLVAGAVILTLAGGGVPYPAVVGVFVALFAAAHLYIFRTDGLMWGLYYMMYATLGGFAFPFLILFIPGGILYAITLHMLFYVLSGIFFATLPRPGKAVQRELIGAEM
ncbi:MAG TPA: hypothetical protein VMV50_00445 [Candidatus Paceibacterota bacterium]|nr:hypothetical protein [Candidatus Paceibacterota bacterium]